MNFRKGIYSLACTLLMSIGSSVYGQSIVELVDDASLYVQTEKGYVLNFDVQANAEEMEHIKNKVASLEDRLVIEVLTHQNGRYSCVFTVNHQNHANYVFKMMTSCGFESLTYKGESFELFKIVEILESYQ